MDNTRIGNGDNVDNVNRLRFSTPTKPLQFVYEMDDFIEFIRQKTRNNVLIRQLIKWLIAEHYDWESLINDIECNGDGNLYSF